MRTAVALLVLTLSSVLSSCALRENAPSAPPGVRVLPRTAWQAHPPVLEMKPHELRAITIHHTATRQQPRRSLAEKMRGLQQFSQHEGMLASGRMKAAWPDVPYHFYIDHRGRIAEGREIGFTGDTNTAYDPTGHILIVLEGNFEEEWPTRGQLRSLRRLVMGLAVQWQVPAERVQGHKDYADTLCPGTHLYAYLPELRALVASAHSSR